MLGGSDEAGYILWTPIVAIDSDALDFPPRTKFLVRMAMTENSFEGLLDVLAIVLADIASWSRHLRTTL